MPKHDHDKDDYEVGYRRPPVTTRFKKGQSGNPLGRPHGAKGFRASLKKELAAKITVREGSREVSISKAEAAVKRLIEKALKGDMAALRLLATLEASFHANAEAPSPDVVSTKALDQNDSEILKAYAERIRSSASDTEGSSEGPDDPR